MITERDISQVLTIIVYIFAIGYAYYQIKKKELVFLKGPLFSRNLKQFILNIKNLYKYNIIIINWVLIIVFSLFMDIALLQQFALQQVDSKPVLFFIGAPGYVITSIVIWSLFDNQTRQYKQLIDKQNNLILLLKYNKEKLKQINGN